MTTVGIVSPGAMGSAVGRVLAEGGSRVVASVTGRSGRTRRLADALELLPSLEDVVAASDVVLSIVPPGAAFAAAASIAHAAREQGVAPVVADLNAVSPATARAIADVLAAAGTTAVDGSISGPPPRVPGTTVVYLSGPEAARVAALPAPGLRFRVVGDEIGAASAVKMSTASVYKGYSALVAQALRAAAANGVLDIVLDDLRRSDPDLADGAPRLLQSIAAKSSRYVAEMEEIASTQAAVGLGPELFEAMAEVYRRMSTTAAARAMPEDVDPRAALADVLAGLDERPVP